MATKLGRSAECGKPQAIARFAHAQNFLEVAELVASEAADAFSELISLKDTAHYGVINVSKASLKVATRRAATLVDFAQSLFDAT